MNGRIIITAMDEKVVNLFESNFKLYTAKFKINTKVLVASYDYSYSYLRHQRLGHLND